LKKVAANFNSDRNTAGVGMVSGGAVATGISAAAIASGIDKARQSSKIYIMPNKVMKAALDSEQSVMRASGKNRLAAGAVLGAAGLGTMIPGLVLAADSDKENAYERAKRKEKKMDLQKVAEDAYWDAIEKLAGARLPSAVRNVMKTTGSKDVGAISNSFSRSAPIGKFKPKSKPAPVAPATPTPAAAPAKGWGSLSTAKKVGVGAAGAFGAGLVGGSMMSKAAEDAYWNTLEKIASAADIAKGTGDNFVRRLIKNNATEGNVAREFYTKSLQPGAKTPLQWIEKRLALDPLKFAPKKK